MESNYILKDKDLKNSFSEIQIEIYNMKDLLKCIRFCYNHSYKCAWIIHTGDDEKKSHIHFYIKSDSYHRFNIKQLVNNETLHPYNFMKCKTTLKDFCVYVMHLQYDFKEKYDFKCVHFINVGRDSIRRINACVSGYHPIDDTSTESDLATPQEFERLLFNGFFQTWQEIVDYCGKTERLRRYLIFHSRQIRDAYFYCFDGNKIKNINEVNEYVYNK